MSKVALVVGSTGLVGTQLVRDLVNGDYYTTVITVSRRQYSLVSSKLQSIISDYSNIEEQLKDVRADDVFCCLGTTIKKAGSEKKFRLIDHDYPLKVAKIMKRNGATQYLLCSSMGADPSSAFFYNRVKGDVEKDITALNYQTFHVFRPSLLLGSRREKRPGEKAGQLFFQAFGFVFKGFLKKYKGVKIEKVAKGMYAEAKRNVSGKYIHMSGEIQNY